MQSVTIQFPNIDILTRAKEKAEKLGISIGEYINKLIASDVKTYKDPWGPVPKWLEKEWEKDFKEFEKEDKKNPRPSFSSGQEYIDYIRKK